MLLYRRRPVILMCMELRSGSAKLLAKESCLPSFLQHNSLKYQFSVKFLVKNKFLVLSLVLLSIVFSTRHNMQGCPSARHVFS